jgi:AcrR family transcriptional regulator
VPSFDFSRQVQLSNTEDRRKSRSLRSIHSALGRLSSVRGFDAITVKDITVLADVHRSTFYRHYRDKFHLIESLYENGVQNGEKSLLEAVNGSASSCECVRAFTEILDHFAAHRELYSALLVHRKSVWFETWLYERWVELITNMHSSLYRSGSPVVNDVLVILRIQMIGATSLAVLKWWVGDRHELTTEQLACWYARHVLDELSRTLACAICVR